ncbi:MAG: IS3 family transposase [Lachnospiraceae bacterium]|nr:IS3 family transposase [Lachnospiraceae bacterium]
MLYQAIKELSETKHYSVLWLCRFLKVARSAYYRWLKHPVSASEQKNLEITDTIEKIHEAHPDMGYRRIRDELDARHGVHVNDKRVLRICRKKKIQSAIKWRPKSCTRHGRDPYYMADNVLNRDFHADRPNEKWLTDVSEFKYGTGDEVHKLYLSAILDLYDRRIVAFQISDRNDNPLVMNTFDKAVKLEPDAHPLFHSDRGFQYTSAQFHTRLQKQGMQQSMSRVAHCIDNGPMEGFWGILKRETYYGKKFTLRENLKATIEEYINYYNGERIQRGLRCMSPLEYHEEYLSAA